MIQSKSTGSKIYMFIIYAILVFAAFLSLAPLVNTIAISFSSSRAASLGTVAFFPKDFSLAAYKKILEDSAFWTSFGVSIERVILGTVTNLVLVITMAFPLSHNTDMFKKRQIYMWILVGTMLFSGGLVPTYLVVTKMGLRNSIWALILPGAVPVYDVILMMNFFKGIPRALEEAAIVDGASMWTILRKIYLPLSIPSLATIALFVIVGHWNAFFDGLIYINDQNKIPLQTYLQQLVLQQQQADLSAEDAAQMLTLSSQTLNAAKILISIIPILMVYPFLQRYLIKGLVLGAVKE